MLRMRSHVFNESLNRHCLSVYKKRCIQRSKWYIGVNGWLHNAYQHITTAQTVKPRGHHILTWWYTLYLHVCCVWTPSQCTNTMGMSCFEELNCRSSPWTQKPQSWQDSSPQTQGALPTKKLLADSANGFSVGRNIPKHHEGAKEIVARRCSVTQSKSTSSFKFSQQVIKWH